MEKYRRLTLTIHYLDDVKIKKGVWFFKKEQEGTLYYFEYTNDGFGNQFSKIELLDVHEGDCYGFVVVELLNERPNWNKKDGSDRMFRIDKSIINNDEIHIYAISDTKNSKLLFKQPRMINVHLRREREDYEGLNLFAFVRNDLGNSYHFQKDREHAGYQYVKIPVEFFGERPRKIWFQTYRYEQSHSLERIKRYIDMKYLKDDPYLDVFIRNDDTKIYFEKPRLLHTRVNIYYKRHDNDYSGWAVSYFIDKANNFQRFAGDFGAFGGDLLFKRLTFSLDYPEGAKELQFYLRKGPSADSIDYKVAPLKENEMDVYMLQDVYETFQTRREAELHIKPKIIKAVLHNPGDDNENFQVLWLETNVPLSDDTITHPQTFGILGQDKHKVKVKNITYTDDSKRRFQLVMEPGQMKPFKQKYTLKISPQGTDKGLKFEKGMRISIEKLYGHQAFNSAYCYVHEKNAKDFGLQIHGDLYTFTLWSPTADAVKLKIYHKGTGANLYKDFPMQVQAGLWSVALKQTDVPDIENKFYSYEILTDDVCNEVADPYGKAAGINAIRTAILRLEKTDPAGWNNHKRPLKKIDSPVIYELHIKDFTMGKGSIVPPQYQGKYLGVPYMIPHLKNLGINCVQLLPVTKFASDETRPNGGGYNWGYDQTGLWFLPEGIYATDPHDPAVRIREFKQMVMALHEHDIRVIIDGVHNHTYLTENSVLNQIIHAYYYRMAWDDTFYNGSGCGNELKTERPIVRKLVRDYLKYWVKEMGVDGFRFDLMSLTDKYTMELVRKDVDLIHPHCLLYGEAYRMGWSILPYHLQTSKENITQNELTGIGAFTDIGSRNAIRGHNEKPGLANGAGVESEASYLFYVGQKGEFIDWTSRNNSTDKVFNYVDIHDDMLLIDYLKQSHLHLSKKEIMQRYKLAYSMLFNYIGSVVLKAGTEGVTTKLGDFNSYRTEDVNLIDWTRMEKYADILQYFSDYIKFRLSHPAYMMGRHEVNTKFESLDSHGGYVKGKMFKDYANGDPVNKLLIFHNLSKDMLEVNLPSHKGGWALLGDDKQIGNKRIGKPLMNKLILPGLTTIVLGDNNSVEELTR